MHQDQAGKEETKKGQHASKAEGANEAALRKGFPGAFFVRLRRRTYEQFNHDGTSGPGSTDQLC